MALRITHDFAASPQGLRKTLNAKDVVAMQKVCAGWEFLLSEFRKKVSGVWEVSSVGTGDDHAIIFAKLAASRSRAALGTTTDVRPLHFDQCP